MPNISQPSNGSTLNNVFTEKTQKECFNNIHNFLKSFAYHYQIHHTVYQSILLTDSKILQYMVWTEVSVILN